MKSTVLRYAMIGGGIGSFMGPVHRAALAMTGLAVPVCGYFSRNAEKNQATALSLGLPAEKAYPDLPSLLAAKEKEQFDFVVIVSRSAYHYQQLIACFEAGLPVVCDKPVCSTSAEGKRLLALQKEIALDCMVTYTYSGYPMLAEARERIRQGELGDIRIVAIEYLQDWMVRRYQQAEDKSVFWRTNPEEIGPSCCVADIGVHAAYIAKFLTGQKTVSLAADVQGFTEGMPLEDNAFIWAKLGEQGQIKGQYWCSQIAIGKHNQIKVHVSGSKGSIEWNHAEADVLKLYRLGQSESILKRNDPCLTEFSKKRTFLLPLEHPEGTLEAFAVLYRAFCRTLLAKRAGQPAEASDMYPTLRDGVEGVLFVERSLASSKAQNAWVDFSDIF